MALVYMEVKKVCFLLLCRFQVTHRRLGGKHHYWLSYLTGLCEIVLKTS